MNNQAGSFTRQQSGTLVVSPDPEKRVVKLWGDHSQASSLRKSLGNVPGTVSLVSELTLSWSHML
jgi:hypothetical protein